MSTQNPLQVPSIPMPTDDPASVLQTLIAMKQNIEIAQGTRGTVRATGFHPPTPLNAMLDAAIKATIKSSG